MKKILLTGSAGFIFSNFLRYTIDNNLNYDIVSIDKLVELCNFHNIVKNQPLHIGDIADAHFIDRVFRKEKPDIVIHGAAESNVDASIQNAMPFMHSNILGTQVMVDMSLKHGIEKFLFVSTDEVYGQHKTISAPGWKEDAPLAPRSPYSASKASGELIVKAAHETHGLPYLITRCCNNYGPRQKPRNLLPQIITSIWKKQPIPIHGNGQQRREWLYVEDNCTAILKILEMSPINETYNIGSGIEFSNIDMVDQVSKLMGVEKNIEFVSDRKGHDYRYSVDCSRLEKLGWKKKYSFDQALRKCVDWYVDNQDFYLNSNE